MNGSKLKFYRQRDKPLLSINMLDYDTKGDWTVGQSNEIEEDLVIVIQPYRLDENWVDLLTFLEQRPVPKHVEGITVPRRHKNLTNAFFGTPSLWKGTKDIGGERLHMRGSEKDIYLMTSMRRLMHDKRRK